MASAEDIRASLANDCPPEVSQTDVEKLVNGYFHGWWHPGPGSHLYIIEHPWLQPPFMADNGRLSIAVHHGKVKQWMVVKLLRAIEVVETGRAQGVPEKRV